MTLEARLGVGVGAFDLDVEFTVARGEVLAVLGPERGGQDHAVRAVAGLLALDRGQVQLDGEVLDDPVGGVFVPAERRPIGVVFQQYLLFGHLSALENVAFGLRARGVAKAEARRRAADLLGAIRYVGLRPGAARRPVRRSGAACRVGSGARHRPARAAARRAARRARCRDASGGAPRPPRASRLVRRHATARDARSGRRLCAGRSGGHPRRRADRPGRHDRGGDRPPAIEIRRRTGRHQPRRRNGGRWRADERRWGPGGRRRCGSGPLLAVIRPQAVTLARSASVGTSVRNAWPGVVVDIDRLGDRVRVSIDGPLHLTAEITASGSTRWRCAQVIRCTPRSRPPTSTPTRPDRFEPLAMSERTGRWTVGSSSRSSPSSGRTVAPRSAAMRRDRAVASSREASFSVAVLTPLLVLSLGLPRVRPRRACRRSRRTDRVTGTEPSRTNGRHRPAGTDPTGTDPPAPTRPTPRHGHVDWCVRRRDRRHRRRPGVRHARSATRLRRA